jgi:hypothetical protein
VPVKACAWHYGNSFKKMFVYVSPHVLSFTIAYYPSLTKIFPYQLCGCMCETQNTVFFLILNISERKWNLPHNSVCIGTSMLSVVELVNTRSSSIFLHFFTDIFFLQIFLFYKFFDCQKAVNYLEKIEHKLIVNNIQ